MTLVCFTRRGQAINPPTYKFVTASELSSLRSLQTERAEEKLQMPPVLDERRPVNKVMAKDEAIRGWDMHLQCLH